VAETQDSPRDYIFRMHRLPLKRMLNTDVGPRANLCPAGKKGSGKSGMSSGDYRWCPAHDIIAGNEQADTWAEFAADESEAPGVPLLRPLWSACDIPPASLAHLKRIASEVKWKESLDWAYERVNNARQYHQLKTGHALTAEYLKVDGKPGSASLEQFGLENTSSRIADHGRCNRLTCGCRFGRRPANSSGGGIRQNPLQMRDAVGLYQPFLGKREVGPKRRCDEVDWGGGSASWRGGRVGGRGVAMLFLFVFVCKGCRNVLTNGGPSPPLARAARKTWCNLP